MSEYSIYICLQYTNTQFEACFNTEIFNLTKIKKLSDKVIPKRIYVILSNLVLLRIFLINRYRKSRNRLREIKFVPEKEFKASF